MHLAKLQFAALLYALLVPFQVDVVPPCTLSQALLLEGGEGSPPPPKDCVGVGGGTALLPYATCVGRAGCVSYVREPRLSFTTPSRFDLELEGARGSPSHRHYRLHLVKLADMFTTWDGHVPYRVRSTTTTL